jgi:hypothetical protein
MHTSRNVAVLSLIVGLLPTVVLAQDSTQVRGEGRTLAGTLGLRGMHVGFGGGAAPYLDTPDGAATSEFRFGVSPKRAPDWAFAVGVTVVTEGDTTGYVVPNSNNFHPRMTSTAVGLEVQRRWRRTSILHPMLVAGVGGITNSYTYWEYPAGGDSRLHEDASTTSSYASLGAGGEVSVFSWMRLAVVMSYRAAGRMRIPDARGTNSGAAGWMLLEFGKF